MPQVPHKPNSLFISWVGLVGASQSATVSSHRTGLLWLAKGWVPTRTCMPLLFTPPHRPVRVYMHPHISAAAVLPLSLPDASSSWGNLGTAPLSDVYPLGIPTGSPPGSLSPGHQNVPACVRVCLRFVTNQTHCSSVGWVRVAPHSVQLCLCFLPSTSLEYSVSDTSATTTQQSHGLPPQILSNFT